MMKQMAAVVLIAAALPSMANAQVCGFRAGYDEAQTPRERVTRALELQPAPGISLLSLRRGFEDNDPTSCSAYGELTFVLADGEYSPTAVYQFTLLRGVVPEGALPDGFIEPVMLPTGDYGFRFDWLDAEQGDTTLQPIAAEVSVVRMTYAGEPSQITSLQLVDVGGVVATTAARWNNTMAWVVITVILALLLLMRAHRKKSASNAQRLAKIREELAARAAELRKK